MLVTRQPRRWRSNVHGSRTTRGPTASTSPMRWHGPSPGQADPVAARPFVDRALRLGTSDPLLHYHAAVVLEANGELGRGAGGARPGLRAEPVLHPPAARRRDCAGRPARCPDARRMESRESSAAVLGRAALAGPLRVRACGEGGVRPRDDGLENLEVDGRQVRARARRLREPDQTLADRRRRPPLAPPRPARRPRVRGAASPPSSAHPNVSGTAKNARRGRSLSNEPATADAWIPSCDDGQATGAASPVRGPRGTAGAPSGGLSPRRRTLRIARSVPT